MRKIAPMGVVWLLILGAVSGFIFELGKLPPYSEGIASFLFFALIKLAKWITVGWSMFLILLALHMKWSHRALSHGHGRELRRITRELQKGTKINYFIKPGLLEPALLAVGAMALYFKLGYIDLLFLTSVLAARIIWVWVRLTEFPALLFLTTSANREKIYNHYDFRMFISPFRVAALLDYSSEEDLNHPGSGRLYNSICLDVFRTTSNNDWRDTLHQLMQDVTVIVVDCRFVTEHTDYEARYVLHNGLQYKTLFLTDEDGMTPLLDGVPSSNGELCQCKFGELFKYLKLVFYDLMIPSRERPLSAFDIRDIGEPVFHFKSTTAEHYCRLGNASLARRDFDQAEEAFVTALAATPQHHESLWTNLAIVSLNRRDLDTALERIKIALSKNPCHPNAILTAGMVYEHQGDQENASRKFTEFLMVAKVNDKARIQYARSRLR